MKTRTPPRVIPDTPVYVSVTLPEPKGEHHFRTPSTVTGAKLLNRLQKTHLAAFSALSGHLNNPAGIFALVQQVGPELVGVLGFIVGVSWCHKTLDLESTLGPKDDPLEFGERVIEELHEAEYDLNLVVLLAMVVMRQWVERNSLSQEAMQRAGFFSPTTGPTTSSPSTSESTTSATPGASGN